MSHFRELCWFFTFAKQYFSYYVSVTPPAPPSDTYKNAYDAKFKYYMSKYNKILEQNKIEQEKMLDKADKEAATTVQEQLKLQYGEDFYNSVILGETLQSNDFDTLDHMHLTPTEGASIGNKSVVSCSVDDYRRCG